MTCEFKRILGARKDSWVAIEPVLQAGEQKSQCCTPRQGRKCCSLVRRERACVCVRRDHASGFRAVKAAVWVEAPGVEHYCDIVGKEIVAGEIEINQARHPAVKE